MYSIRSTRSLLELGSKGIATAGESSTNQTVKLTRASGNEARCMGLGAFLPRMETSTKAASTTESTMALEFFAR